MKMSKIKNALQLRDHLLDKLDQLENKQIEIEELGQIAKASETILASLKIQLAYAGMRSEIPHIEFLEDCNKGIPVELNQLKKLE
jgi:hypothetical protein